MYYRAVPRPTSDWSLVNSININRKKTHIFNLSNMTNKVIPISPGHFGISNVNHILKMTKTSLKSMKNLMVEYCHKGAGVIFQKILRFASFYRKDTFGYLFRVEKL